MKTHAVLTHAKALGPFLTVLLSSPSQKADVEDERPRTPTADAAAEAGQVANGHGEDTQAPSLRPAPLIPEIPPVTTEIAKEVGQRFCFGDVCIDVSCMEVTFGGRPVRLTRQEFKMLQYLLRHSGKTISRQELLDQVWGYQHYPCTRTVDSHMWKLRQKLEQDPAKPLHFHTVHGVGYTFVP
jgi:DNA-binding response OmpR family regulator